jgi:hypothetical protein
MMLSAASRECKEFAAQAGITQHGGRTRKTQSARMRRAMTRASRIGVVRNFAKEDAKESSSRSRLVTLRRPLDEKQ